MAAWIARWAILGNFGLKGQLAGDQAFRFPVSSRPCLESLLVFFASKRSADLCNFSHTAQSHDISYLKEFSSQTLGLLLCSGSECPI